VRLAIRLQGCAERSIFSAASAAAISGQIVVLS